MDQQQFERFLVVMREAMTGGHGEGGTGTAGTGKRILDDKMFTRMEVYGGDRNKWKDWDFNLQLILGAASPKLGEFMDWVSQQQGQVDEKTLASWRSDVDLIFPNNLELFAIEIN